ncbi:hypothetical protein NAI77_10600, partial [Francisella tularensis subsp. holarctica]|uniref:hypothetical protein n=1 Tax=Francisella tularensis TaxID=263 RepID=UPI002381A8DF
SWQINLGSSNLTQSALTINKDWNFLIKTSLADVTTKQILAEFDYLFDREKYPSDILYEYIQIYQRDSELANKRIQRK